MSYVYDNVEGTQDTWAHGEEDYDQVVAKSFRKIHPSPVHLAAVDVYGGRGSLLAAEPGHRSQASKRL